jgi:ankyrin repeat protein
MKAEDLIYGLEKVSPDSAMGFLIENQEFINETTEDEITVLEHLLKKGMAKLSCEVIQLETFDPNLSGHNFLQTSLALGYTDVAVHLLNNGCNPNYCAEGRASALLTCLENEFFDTAEVMMQYGAEVDIRSDNGWTPLIWASIKGRTKAVDFLLGHGANVNICNDDGWNALTGAFFKRRTEIVTILQEKGAVFGSKYAEAALLSAYDNGYLDVVKNLIQEHGTSINIADENNVSLLCKAVEKGDWPFVTFLLEHGVDVNVFNKDGRPLIAVLARDGHEQYISAFIENGADIHLSSANGKTAIHVAADYNQVSTLEKLVDLGANVNAQSNSGITPLIDAAISGYLELAKKLISLGANTELQSESNKNALYNAKQWAVIKCPREGFKLKQKTAHMEIAELLTLPGHSNDD